MGEGLAYLQDKAAMEHFYPWCYVLETPIYKIPVFFTCAPQAVKYIQQYDDLTGGIACLVPGVGIVIVLAVATKPILAHELVHAAVMVCQSAGVPVNEDNDEVLAYLVEYYFEQFEPCLKKSAYKSMPNANAANATSH